MQESDNLRNSISNQYDTITEMDQYLIKDAIIVMSSLSLLFSIIVILAYFYFKSSQSFSKKLVVNLCVADAAFALSHIIYFKDPENDVNQAIMCQIQAYFMTLSGLSSIIWTTLISYSIYKSVIYNIKDLSDKQTQFIVIGYVLPSIISLFPLFINEYGPSQSRGNNGAFCWIQTYSPSKWSSFLSLMLFYIPLWVSFILNCVFIRLVLQKIRQVSTNQYYIQKKMMFYPLILAICWLPATIHRIYDMVEHDCSHFKLFLVHIIFGYSNSIFNALIYGFNERILQKIRQYCDRFKRTPKQPDFSKNQSQIQFNSQNMGGSILLTNYMTEESKEKTEVSSENQTDFEDNSFVDFSSLQQNQSNNHQRKTKVVNPSDYFKYIEEQ